jgi:hypothetical protein
MASEEPATAGEWTDTPIGAGCSEKRSPTGTRLTDEGRARALVKIGRDYPGWHAWRGTLGGVVYARRPRTSPPLVVRATTTDRLRRETKRPSASEGSGEH